MNKLILLTGKDCPLCDKAKSLCEQKGLEYTYKQLGTDFTREELFEIFPGARTFPQIKIDGENIGGYQQLEEWHNTDWNDK